MSERADKPERQIVTPHHEDATVVRDVRGAYGPLMDSYPGLILNIGALRAPTAQALYLAMRQRDDANVRAEVLAQGTSARRNTDTWIQCEEEDEALRLWVAKVKVMQHPGPVRRALARTAGTTIIMAGEPPEGMRRRAGQWSGEGRAGLRWETIRDRISERGERPIAAVRTPAKIAGALCVDGVAVQRIRRDGSVE